MCITPISTGFDDSWFAIFIFCNYGKKSPGWNGMRIVMGVLLKRGIPFILFFLTWGTFWMQWIVFFAKLRQHFQTDLPRKFDGWKLKTSFFPIKMALGGLFTPFSVTKTTFGPSNVRSIKLGDEVRLVFSATLTASVVDLQLVLEMVDPRVIEQVANWKTGFICTWFASI